MTAQLLVPYMVLWAALMRALLVRARIAPGDVRPLRTEAGTLGARRVDLPLRPLAFSSRPQGYDAPVREILPELERWRADGHRVAMARVVATRRSAPRPVGSKLIVSETGELAGSVSGGCVESEVVEAAREVLAGGEPRLLTYGISDDLALSVGLPCGGEIDVWVSEPDAAAPDGARGRRERRAARGRFHRPRRRHRAARPRRRRDGGRRADPRRAQQGGRARRQTRLRRRVRPAAALARLWGDRHRRRALRRGPQHRLAHDRRRRARPIRDA